MTKLGTALLLIVTAFAGCDSNPTPHPMRYGSDATDEPNRGDVGGIGNEEVDLNPEPGVEDPDGDPNDCPCANPDNGYAGEDDNGTGRNEDDNATDPCDDDNGTAADPDDTDSESPEPSTPTVRGKRFP